MQQHDTTPKEDHYVCAIDASLTGMAVATMIGRTCVVEEHSSSLNRTKTKKSKPPPLSTRERVARYSALVSNVRETLTGINVSCRVPRWHVFIEGYSFASAHAAHQLGEFGGLLRSELLAHPKVFTVTEVQPTQLKKFCTGKGNANKIEVATALTHRYGIAFSSDNKADAYGLAKIGACVVGDDEPANQAQRDVVLAVREHYEKDFAQYSAGPYASLPEGLICTKLKVGT